MKSFPFILSAMIVIQSGIALAGPANRKTGDDGNAPDPRIGRMLDDMGFKYVIDPEHDYVLSFDTGAERSQIVWINSDTEDIGNARIREVWSVAYRGEDPLPVPLMEQLLKNNMRLKMGSWALHRSGDTRTLVLTVRVPANANQDLLKAALFIAANATDDMEREIEGHFSLPEDQH